MANEIYEATMNMMKTSDQGRPLPISTRTTRQSCAWTGTENRQQGHIKAQLLPFATLLAETISSPLEAREQEQEQELQLVWLGLEVGAQAAPAPVVLVAAAVAAAAVAKCVCGAQPVGGHSP
jgi:hypothetical protein